MCCSGLEATIRIRLGGRDVDMTPEVVQGVLRDVPTETVRFQAVRIDGTLYPVKQVVALATGLDRLDPTTVNAGRLLQRLGLGVLRVGDEGDA